MNRQDATSHWYREPYVWLVLSPLIVSVIGGFWTLGIVIDSGGHEALPGEYRSTGKLIELDPEALDRSKTIAATMSGRLSPADGTLRLVAEADVPLPRELTALVIHPTQPERDLTIELVRSGSGYRAALPSHFPQRGELHVFPPDHGWRVVAGYAGDSELVFRPIRR